MGIIHDIEYYLLHKIFFIVHINTRKKKRTMLTQRMPVREVLEAGREEEIDDAGRGMRPPEPLTVGIELPLPLVALDEEEEGALEEGTSCVVEFFEQNTPKHSLGICLLDRAIAAPLARAVARVPQIGRASCRERVCLYV